MHFYTAFLMRCPDIFYIISPLSVIVISNDFSSGFFVANQSSDNKQQEVNHGILAELDVHECPN